MLVNNKASEIAEEFALAARQYCSIVDSAATPERTNFLLQIYRALPKLISIAMALPRAHLGDDTANRQPNLRMTNEEWNNLYQSLKQRVEGWDLYKKVFDPTKIDDEPIFGSLADDLADIYRDVKEGILVAEAGQVELQELIFEWRFSFYSHWGKHAIDALEVIHCRLSESLM